MGKETRILQLKEKCEYLFDLYILTGQWCVLVIFILITFFLCQIMKEIQEHKIKIYEFPDTEDDEDNKLIRKIKVMEHAVLLFETWFKAFWLIKVGRQPDISLSYRLYPTSAPCLSMPGSLFTILIIVFTDKHIEESSLCIVIHVTLPQSTLEIANMVLYTVKYFIRIILMWALGDISIIKGRLAAAFETVRWHR